MKGYRARFIASLVVAIISGALVVHFFYGELGSGDTSVWIWAIISLIAFGVSAPMAVYYKGRRNSRTMKEKAKEIIDVETAKVKEQYGEE